MDEGASVLFSLRQSFCDAVDILVSTITRLMTIAAVHPPSRFGVLDLDSDRITRMREKPVLSDQWINGGVYVVDPDVLALIGGDSDQLETATLPMLAERRELMAFRHEGFWQCMDTPGEAKYLNSLWQARTGKD